MQKMSTLRFITQGLTRVDPAVSELFSSDFNSAKAVGLARRLGADMENLDNYRMAGRIWMYVFTRAVSNDIHAYVKTNKHRLAPKIRHFLVSNADRINEVLNTTVSKNFIMFDILQASTLTNSYLLRPSSDDEPSETPEQMFMRIAVQFYYEMGIDRVIQCYLEMSDRQYTPASPTIFNAGTKRAQMASCFLLSIEDDLTSILYTGVGDAGMISKCNGGLGFNIQQIRHSEIGESGMSSGVLPFARIYDRTIDCVDQGGMRKGAGTAFLRPFHIDIRQFIESTLTVGVDHTQRLFNLNTSIWMSRLFFERASKNQKWTLFCPARAKILNELYGYEFEKAYIEMEHEAEKRENEYINCLTEIKGLDAYVASLESDEGVTVDQRASRPLLMAEQAKLREELTTATDEDRITAIKFRLFGLKNRLLSNPEDEALAEQLRKLQEKKRALNRSRITHYVISDAYELLKLIATVQINSSMPYIMHADSVNAKSNQKNLGAINSSNLCVAPETPIFTRHGSGPIKDYEGKEIDVWNGTEFSKTTIVKTGVSQKIITVQLSNGLWLECTPYHKFLVPEGNYDAMRKFSIKTCPRKEAQDLHPGDKLFKFETPVIQGSPEYNFVFPYTHGFWCGDGTLQNLRSDGKRSKTLALYGEKKLLVPHLEIRSMSGIEDAHGRLNTMLPDELEDKFKVPLHGTIDNRLEWFAGLMDADGTVAWNKDNASLQIRSVNFGFLYQVFHLLQGLGIQSKIAVGGEESEAMFPDGKGGYTKYKTQKHWRLTISSVYTVNLVKLGFNPKRLKLDGACMPARKATQYVTVIGVHDRGRVADTYCFNEPLNNAGVFNGILTGQCQEICERSGISPLSGEEEIASCNLSSMNLPRYVKHPLDWKTTTVSTDEIADAYDFVSFGQAVRSATENLDRVIELNYYPLDERDESGNVIKRGKISRPNFRHRPIGLGASGLADTFYALDIPYIGARASMVNKMIFASMYFNSLAESLRLAIRDGPYQTFRAGTYKQYAGLGPDGTPNFETRKGSPLANGQFQFDLWEEDAQLLADLGRLDTAIYQREEDIAMEPTIWGQKPISIHETTTDGDEVIITVEPSWDSLRHLIMKYGTRHSLNIAMMPTATSAQILGNLESTEAPQTLFYTRKLLKGNFTVVLPALMMDLRSLGLDTPSVFSFILGMNSTLKYLDRYIVDHLDSFPQFLIQTGSGDKIPQLDEDKIARVRYLQLKYKTMFEISQKEIIKQAATRGRYICQSQSLNIYLPNPTKDQLTALHMYSNKAGIKTGMYYLRQKPAVAVANFNGNLKLAKYIQSITGTDGLAGKLLAEAASAAPSVEEELRGCGTSCSA